NQRPQARPLEGVDRTLALPLPNCRPTSYLGFLWPAVTPCDPCTLSGEDAGVSPFSLRYRICDYAAYSFDLPSAPPHQREKMKTATPDQFCIADLLTRYECSSQFLFGLLELTRQQEAVAQ